ncbi:IMP cyclohydrolase [Bdellovibrio bacteriovorus W]|nr:IMP cyclohydrolase [Bdellovibrio bacteriovorus W]
MNQPIRRALLSVSDKRNLLSLAKALASKNVELIASGGTAKALSEAGFAVTPVETLSGKGEAFQGRMKTISFEIASSLLFRRDDPSDLQQAQELGIQPIDLVVVNLYPFHETLKSGKDFATCIENIDIGGPTLLRAGAKNFKSVTVLSNPAQYEGFIAEFEGRGNTSLEFRQRCAADVFQMTSFYDQAIAVYLLDQSGAGLRYGENPHQKGLILKDPFQAGLAHVESPRGKEMSYNNYLDSDFALRTLQDFIFWQAGEQKPTAIVVKHNTPCGIAIAKDPLEALENAWNGDVKSSFGGIIALSFPVTLAVAEFFKEKFVEVIMAPEFSEDAEQLLKKNCRTLKVSLSSSAGWQARGIDGGVLMQEKDAPFKEDLKVVTQRPFDEDKKKLAEFSALAVKNLKSNAIALCRETASGYELVTMGAGQTNRIDCIEILIATRLKDKKISEVANCVLSSDAFFPFADSVEAAAKLGVKYIVQPGGSVKDSEVIAEADRREVAMAFTGRRHFLH